ncbi:MAG: patatin-like phospholipase family protein [Brevundimonas sp.]
MARRAAAWRLCAVTQHGEPIVQDDPAAGGHPRRLMTQWTRATIYTRAAAVMAAVLGLAACGTISRVPISAEQVSASPYTRDLDRYRFPSGDEGPFLAWLGRWAGERRARGMDGVKGLALSGGGANGAYGAGVLVGWSERGDRPRFDIVTGVSTGALAAPMAFVGPAWDGHLAEAYQNDRLKALTADRLAVLRNPSLYGSGPLTRLVDRYVTADLLKAIAVEHAAGRRLVVATTNLDTRSAMIWDLGAIATDAGDAERRDAATALFKRVLVAAASIPGIFPPVIISADPEGVIGEMHVDGGVIAPFFLVPETLNFWRPEALMRPTDLYLIINGQTGSAFSMTGGASVAIVERTLDTLGRADARNQIRFVSAFASRNGAAVAVAAIPDALEANPLKFDADYTKRLFALGRDRAFAGQAFAEPGVLEWLRDDPGWQGRSPAHEPQPNRGTGDANR